MSPGAPTLLSQALCDQYQRDGYLVLPDAVPADHLAAMQTATARLIDASRTVNTNDDVYDLDTGHDNNTPRLNRIKQPHIVATAFNDYLRSDALLNLLRPILGDHIRLHNSKLNTKAGGGGTAVQWHQDWAFYPHTNDDLLAVGVMLSDINEVDGPLQVVPGSHRGPALSHANDGVFCGAIDPADPEAHLDQAVSLTGTAGSISLHHVRCLHGSAPNRGENPRLLLLYELGAADAWPLQGAVSSYQGMAQAETWDSMNSRMVCGQQPHVARLADVPVLMPVAPPRDGSSIFKVQESGRAIDAFVNA